jgi:hypothetical protein
VWRARDSQGIGGAAGAGERSNGDDRGGGTRREPTVSGARHHGLIGGGLSHAAPMGSRAPVRDPSAQVPEDLLPAASLSTNFACMVTGP